MKGMLKVSLYQHHKSHWSNGINGIEKEREQQQQQKKNVQTEKMKLFQIIESIIKIFESLSDYMTDEWLVTFSIISLLLHNTLIIYKDSVLLFGVWSVVSQCT